MKTIKANENLFDDLGFDKNEAIELQKKARLDVLEAMINRLGILLCGFPDAKWTAINDRAKELLVTEEKYRFLVGDIVSNSIEQK